MNLQGLFRQMKPPRSAGSVSTACCLVLPRLAGAHHVPDTVRTAASWSAVRTTSGHHAWSYSTSRSFTAPSQQRLFCSSCLRLSQAVLSSKINRYGMPNKPFLVLAASPFSTTSHNLSNVVNNAQSSTTAIPVSSSVDNIPEPPPIPVSEAVSSADPSTIVAGAEPTLASLGLGGWWPSGMVQECLYWMHTSLDMPWWLSIVVGTVIVRTCLFPLVVKAQQNAAKMNNNMPQMQLLQVKMTEARRSGNAIEAAKYAHELMNFMKEKDVNPAKGMIIPLIQAPIFISVFFGLRGMANVPVESLRDGGIFWFTDLTVPDPLYLLPIITCSSLFLSIELGAEGGVRTDNMQIMRFVLRALPVVIFPFIINFPSAMLVYWCTSNILTLGQVAILRLPPVREKLNIPTLIKHNPEQLPRKKGFVEGIKESMTNSKIAREIEDRHRVDEMRFRRAGTGPLIKTYPYDPTKQQLAKSADDRKTSNIKD